MKTEHNKNVVNQERSAMKFDNPLGLVFETPKSEANLRSATMYDAADKAPNAERPAGPEAGAVSSWGDGSFAIAQILG